MRTLGCQYIEETYLALSRVRKGMRILQGLWSQWGNVTILPSISQGGVCGMSHIPHTQNVYFFRGIHFSLSQIATSVQWVLAWNVFNKSHFFSLELGANRCAKGATSDDWEELIRALGEKAIDFTVFLCLSVLFRAFRQLSGIPQQTHHGGWASHSSIHRVLYQSIWPSRALILLPHPSASSAP